MLRSEIESVVLNAIRLTNRSLPAEKRVEEAATAAIFGPGSSLDSLGLVTLLIDVEDALREAGVDVLLSDERAMSQRRSPFRDVPSLVGYVEGRLQGGE
jgi:hypothetical protein